MFPNPDGEQTYIHFEVTSPIAILHVGGRLCIDCAHDLMWEEIANVYDYVSNLFIYRNEKFKDNATYISAIDEELEE